MSPWRTHLNPVYSFSNKYFLPKTESESKTTLSIPYNEKLTELQADHIISVVKNKLR